MKIRIFLLFLAYLIPNVNSLEQIERDVTLSLIKKQNIHNLIILYKSINSETFKDFNFFTKKRILTNAISENDFLDYLFKIKKVERKTLVTFKNKHSFDQIFLYFFKMKYFPQKTNNTYSHEISKFQWATFNPENVNFHVSWDCQFFIIKKDEDKYNIEEIYGQHLPPPWTNMTILVPLGTWSKSTGLNMTKVDFHTRRSNFQKMNYFGLIYWIPGEDSCPEAIQCKSIKIAEMLGEMLNFSLLFPSFLTDEERKYFSPDIHLTLLPFKDSMSYQDFIGQLITFNYHMFISNKLPREIPISIYKDLLSIKFWIFSATIMTLYALLKMLILSNHRNSNQFLSVNWLAIYSSATKIIMFLILTTKVSILPFNNLQTFIEDGTYKTAAILDHYTETHLKISNDEKIKTILEKYYIDPEEQRDTLSQNLKRLCYDKKFAFITLNNEQFRKEKLKYGCGMIQIPIPIMKLELGFYLRYQLPQKGMIVRKARLLKSYGILRKINEAINGGIEKTEKKFIFELINPWPMMWILVIGILSSLFVLVLEILI